MKKFITLILLSSFLIGCGTTSNIYEPTELDVIGDYVHDSTQIVFSKSFGEFTRTDVTSFDKAQTNIGVSYKTTKSTISVYIYPAGVAHEGRLKNEFHSSLQSIALASGKEIETTQYPFKYSKNGYTLIGLGAEIGGDNISKKSLLAIFECGKWFLKVRLTSNQSNFIELQSLRDTLINHFSPSDIVQRYPLKQKTHILFAPAILNDSLMMYSVMKSAFKHSAWVLHNIDSLQRCSGFPGLYLAEYSESLNAMVEGIKDSTMFLGPRDPKFWEFISILRRIIDNGYLNEFIMDEHNFLLLTSKDLNLNIDGYRKWALDNNIKRGILDKQYYIIKYIE